MINSECVMLLLLIGFVYEKSRSQNTYQFKVDPIQGNLSFCQLYYIYIILS